MALNVITTPDDMPISLEEVKAHLRVTSDDEDDVIAAMIAASVSLFDGGRGIVGMAMLEQEWELSMDAFPQGGQGIRFPLAPLKSVTSLKYVSHNGEYVELPSSEYIVDTKSWPGRVLPALDKRWPDAPAHPNAVLVSAVCGYADKDSIPANIRHALKLYIGHLYNNREATVATKIEHLPLGVGSLISPYMVRSF